MLYKQKINVKARLKKGIASYGSMNARFEEKRQVLNLPERDGPDFIGFGEAENDHLFFCVVLFGPHETDTPRYLKFQFVF
jgi:hypothetical protein